MHDPKLKGMQEVTAIIRLKLRTAMGQKVWVTRISKLKKQGKSKMKFETLESKLEVAEGNVRKAIATKASTVTERLSDLLGVSPAVLEYVIFCHQEDSNWPLGEPKDLKTRFDEIFAVSRYKKAMDEMKSARKVCNEQVKALDTRLQVLQSHRERIASIVCEIDEKEKERVNLNEEIEKAKEFLRKYTSEAKHWKDMQKHLATTFKALEKATQRAAFLREQSERFGASQNEFSGMNLAELQERKKNLSRNGADADLRRKKELTDAILSSKREIQQIEERRTSLAQSFASIADWSRQLTELQAQRLMIAKRFIAEYKEKFKNFQTFTEISSTFSQAEASSSETSLTSDIFASLVKFASETNDKIKQGMANARATQEAQIKAKAIQLDNQLSVIATLRGDETSLASQVLKKREEIVELESSISHLQSLTGGSNAKGREEEEARYRKEYESKQQRLEELEKSENEFSPKISPSGKALPNAFVSLEMATRTQEANLSVLSHHAEALRLWTVFHALLSRAGAGLEHLLARQRAWNTKLTAQVPSLAQALCLFFDVAPKKADFLSSIIKSATKPASLSIDDIYSEHFIEKMHDTLQARLTLSNARLQELQEQQFDLNSKKSILATETGKLTSEITKLEKTLETTKEAFLKKIKSVRGVEASIVSEIEVFFLRPLSSFLRDSDAVIEVTAQEDEDDDDLIVLTPPTTTSTKREKTKLQKSASTQSATSINSSQPVPEEHVIYASIVSAAEDAQRRAESRIAELKTSRDTFASLRAESTKTSSCAFCTRPLHNHAEEEALDANLRRLVDMIPKQLREAEEDLKLAEMRIKEVKTLEPKWNKIFELIASIPQEKEKLSTFKADALVLASNAANAEEMLTKAQAVYKSQGTVINTVASMLQEATEMKSISSQIDDAIAKSNAIAKPSHMPLDLQSIIESANNQHGEEHDENKEETKNSISEESLESTIVSMVDYDSLENASADEIDNMAASVHALQEERKSEFSRLKAIRASHEHVRRECESFIKKYKDEFIARSMAHSELVAKEEMKSRAENDLLELDSSLVAKRSQLEKATLEEQSIRTSKQTLEETMASYGTSMNAQSAEFTSHITSLASIQTSTETMESKLNGANASDYDSEMELLKQKIEENRESQSKMEVELALLKNQNDAARRRALDEAIRYQEALVGQEAAEIEIQKYQEVANGVTAEELAQKLLEVESKMSAVSHDKSSYLGKLEARSNDLVSKKRELKSLLQGIVLAGSNKSNTPVMAPQNAAEYIEAEYQKLAIELETSKMAVEDLALSIDALDKALMAYHSTKMADINNILKELWENTYQGNDIDYVKIVAESENPDSNAPLDPSATRGNKNFHYRVVMVKGGVDLDMRGRCSAGQKVLASLMIRMALAETFCLKCGILALDEPTSNLDQANVESLAESLRLVIEQRQKQSNFQIIIITHDEEFVKILGRNAWTDNYYKVKKDQNQHTVIIQKSIRELK